MTSPIFKKTIFISLLGHITFFSVFSVSFGSRIPQANYSAVSFWGQFLTRSQVVPSVPKINRPPQPESLIPDKVTREPIASTGYYFKPLLPCLFNAEKETFAPKPQTLALPIKRKDPAIIFHPLLPYSFTLYFKDRQVAHVELDFKIDSSGPKHSILVKRKISSGNLEVDLLSQRYISRYLAIQQARFAPDAWQIVKIDLSTKE